MKGIIISGAGIAGLCFARQLKKHGIAYTIIEKKPQLEAAGAGIALPANAVRALRYMGLSEFADSLHQVNRIIYSRANGKIISQASLLDAPLNLDKFVALERTELLAALQHTIHDDIHFNVTITNLKPRDSGVDVTFTDPELDGHYQAVVGADGIYSTVRELSFESSNLVDLGVTNWRWLCDHPTKDVQPTFMLGMGNIFLAYPMGRNRIYCYAHQADSTEQYQNPDAAHENLQQLFASYKGIAKPLLEKIPLNQTIYTGRLRSVPVPLFSQNDIALIGDASSACSPMLQQGAASAFEDAIVLSELLAHFPVTEAMRLYQIQRSQRVNWVVRTSDDSIKSFVKTNSWFAMMARNLFIKRNGPLNVLGWKQLLSTCPLKDLADFIESHAKAKRV